MADENLKIKKITLGGNTYKIWAEGVDASAISGDIPWSAASGLAGAVSTATTQGFAEASAVAKAINDQIAGVYKVQGSESWENLTATDFTGKINGNVYNLTAVTDGAKDAHGQLLSVGDNVVYVSADAKGTAGWDKLGSSLEGFATTAWTTGYISTATSAEATALWNETTAYINSGVTSAAGATALWNNISTLVDEKTSALSAGVITTSADMTVSANNDKLVQNGAITAYIDEKIGETIAETIDIASDPIYTKAADGTVTVTAAPSAIPNIGALSGYTYNTYIKKTDITYNNETLVINI